MDSLLYFLLFAGLFFVMMRFGCGAHVMGHGHGHAGPGDGQDGSPPSAPQWIAPEYDIDVVCGMTVEPASAKSSVYGGKVYYFCAEECRQKFEVNPAYFEKGTAPRQETENAHAR